MEAELISVAFCKDPWTPPKSYFARRPYSESLSAADAKLGVDI
jgi:hypothetical protein